MNRLDKIAGFSIIVGIFNTIIFHDIQHVSTQSFIPENPNQQKQEPFSYSYYQPLQ